MKLLQARTLERAEIYNRLCTDSEFFTCVNEMADIIYNALSSGKRMYFCGNGGSAADAQHLAAEFSGRYYINREALPVEALQANNSFVTAVSNDYGYDKVFERAVEAFCREGDILFCLSTSGSSQNIINAAILAKEKRVTILGMSGKTGGRLAELCHHCLCVNSQDTALIQEVHLFAGHIICEYVEDKMFG